MDLTPFKDLIKQRCGLCFEDIRIATLEEAVIKKMADSGAVSPEEYYNSLCRYDGEFDRLVSLLTINETYFFREPVYFDLLVMRILPELLSRKQGEAVRILSAGCSTGEEPYSIVMKLMEKYGPAMHKMISVAGFDIDGDALSVARQGVYGQHSFRSVPDDLIEKYFTKTGRGRFRISDSIRNSVGFTELNFLSESYPGHLSGADIIFYRNVSIYFEAETRNEIFRKLAGLLKEGGYLLVSSTETLSHDIGVLSLVEMDGLFLYRRNSRAADEAGKKVPFTSGRQMPEKIAPLKRPVPQQAIANGEKNASAEMKKDAGHLFSEALDYAGAKKYTDSLRCLDTLIEQSPEFIKAYMLKGNVLINMKRLDEAERVCLRGTEIDQLSLESYLLLGLISRMKGDDEAAIKRFKEALYIKGSSWLAHFYLAEIYRGRNDFAAACREYEIVVKLMGKGQEQDQGLVFFPLAFSADQIVHLCSHNLARLKGMATGAGNF